MIQTSLQNIACISKNRPMGHTQANLRVVRCPLCPERQSLQVLIQYPLPFSRSPGYDSVGMWRNVPICPCRSIDDHTYKIVPAAYTYLRTYSYLRLLCLPGRGRDVCFYEEISRLVTPSLRRKCRALFHITDNWSSKLLSWL
jgi:hypothetical protein